MTDYKMKWLFFCEECQSYIKRIKPWGSNSFFINKRVGHNNVSKLIKFMELEKGFVIEHMTFFNLYFSKSKLKRIK